MTDYTAKEAIIKDIPGARARAYSWGAWACPACKEGWQVYIIASDMNICWRCAYKGGDPEAYNKARLAVA